MASKKKASSSNLSPTTTVMSAKKSNLNTLNNMIWRRTINNLNVSEQPIAIFLMGLPAAGKSTVIKQFIESELQQSMRDYFHVDPDIFMTRLHGYNNTKARDFNKQGVIISSKILNKLYDSKYNFIYYGTGKNYSQYITMINKATKNNFKTVLVYVKVNVQIAKSRSKKRSRTVNNSVINTIYNSLSKKQSKGKYKDLTNFEILNKKVDEWYVYNNNEGTSTIESSSK